MLNTAIIQKRFESTNDTLTEVMSIRNKQPFPTRFNTEGVKLRQ